MSGDRERHETEAVRRRQEGQRQRETREKETRQRKVVDYRQR